MKRREHLAFHVPRALCRRTEAVIEAIRADTTPGAHAGELIEVIIELTHTGLHSYFLSPLERADIGALAFGAAKIGVSTAGKSLPTLVRRVVGKMTDEQLREVVDVLDEMLV